MSLPDEDVNRIIQLAASGDAEAQFSYALMLDQGDRVPADGSAAVFWFHKAAKQGLAGACLYLGIKYEFGNNVAQDSSKAIHWYSKAALQDWPAAQYHLGRLYLEGGASTADPAKAYAWLRLAEENEYPGAGEALETATALLSEKKMARAEKLLDELRQLLARPAAHDTEP
ncbi:MAG: sel1 repeat family protein [Desulfobulbaceae bacterium]|nr:sel1 repeat family protein [Desulfobulbaceae bacterium]